MRKSPRPDSPRSSSGRGSSRTSKKEPLYLPEDDDEVPLKKKKRKRDQKTISKHDVVDEITSLLEEEAQKRDGESPMKPSKFKKDFDNLTSLLSPDNKDFHIDKAANGIQRASLAMIVDLIPIAEATYRQTKKEFAAYALSSLIKQANELAAELRVNDDVEGRLATTRDLIHSSFVRIAELLLREKYAFHKAIDRVTNEPSIRKDLRNELDLMIQSYGKGLSEYKELLTAQLTMFISGDPNYLNPHSILEENDDAPKKKKRKKK